MLLNGHEFPYMSSGFLFSFFFTLRTQILCSSRANFGVMDIIEYWEHKMEHNAWLVDAVASRTSLQVMLFSEWIAECRSVYNNKKPVYKTTWMLWDQLHQYFLSYLSAPHVSLLKSLSKTNSSTILLLLLFHFLRALTHDSDYQHYIFVQPNFLLRSSRNLISSLTFLKANP